MHTAPPIFLETVISSPTEQERRLRSAGAPLQVVMCAPRSENAAFAQQNMEILEFAEPLSLCDDDIFSEPVDFSAE